MKSVGFILSVIGALLIIYYLMNNQTASQAVSPIKSGKGKTINQDLNDLKKALNKQTKDQEKNMRREIEKQTGGN